MKDPSTGQRVPRFNPESEWIQIKVPELRIVPQELWDAVKAWQKTLDQKSGGLGAKKRPQHLLSGLLVCGECSGGYSKANTDRYGCSTSGNKGDSVCSNKKTIKVSILEDAVLTALETHLMRDELVQVFCEEYNNSINRLRSLQKTGLKKHEAELSKLVKEKNHIVQATKDGIPVQFIKDELEKISEREDELKNLIKNQRKEVRPMLHPSMALRYRKAITGLKKSLKSGKAAGVKEHVRALIEKIVLTPKENRKELSIDLYGNLAGILKIASKGDSMKNMAQKPRRLEKKVANDNFIFEPSIQVVAGEGFEPTTFGL
ncbi:MAG: hypothetical protein GXP56_00940 [Deltaproteobacteria bacterium]|nr:hypothetical protein [Deltaproteobacteria bacterium]